MEKHTFFSDASYEGFIMMVFGTAIGIIASIIGMVSNIIMNNFMNFFWWLLVLVTCLSIIATWSIWAYFTVKLRERKKEKKKKPRA